MSQDLLNQLKTVMADAKLCYYNKGLSLSEMLWFYGARESNLALMKWLYEEKLVKPNLAVGQIRSSHWVYRDGSGTTALHVAVKRGAIDIVKYLLELAQSGVNINLNSLSYEDGECGTALDLATQGGEIYELLLSACAKAGKEVKEEQRKTVAWLREEEERESAGSAY